MTTPTHSKSFWSTFPGIATAVGGFLTAVAGFIAALTGAGMLGPHDPGGGTTPTTVVTAAPATTQPPVNTTTQAPTRDDRAAVELVYTGDNYGCDIQVIVNIGGQTAQPTGSSYVMDNVPTGVQRYTIRGVIGCASLGGQCTASGSGSVSVSDGASYRVTWLLTATGRCTVTLAE